jgi:predicted ATPase
LRERTSFFLRAESFYNVATEIEHLGMTGAYGDRSLHERSHGESFLDLIEHRFRAGGLYLMDEPEAALSPRGALVALARIHDLTMAGSQFLIATHSPILLAIPGATIIQVGLDGTLSRVSYDDAETVQVTRDFLAAPQRSLRHLLDIDPDHPGR